MVNNRTIGYTDYMVETESQQMLPELMAKIAAMRPAALRAVFRFVQELELAGLMEDIQDDAEALRLAGKLDPDLIHEAVREHRARNPYG